jgi:antitoxin VapB
MEIAKVFWFGRSQAVRLPKDYRFEADEVRISRHGTSVILDPIANDWAWLADIDSAVDEDFEQAANEEPADQKRPALKLIG